MLAKQPEKFLEKQGQKMVENVTYILREMNTYRSELDNQSNELCINKNSILAHQPSLLEMMFHPFAAGAKKSDLIDVKNRIAAVNRERAKIVPLYEKGRALLENITKAYEGKQLPLSPV
jgi:GTPase involved in cell partitioning and DNA repair